MSLYPAAGASVISLVSSLHMPHPSIDIPISLYFYKRLASSLACLAAAMRVTPEHAARREKTLLELHRCRPETRLQASDCKSNVPVFRFTSGGTARTTSKIATALLKASYTVVLIVVPFPPRCNARPEDN